MNMRPAARCLSTAARSSRLVRPRTYLEKFEEKAAKHWRPEQVRSVTAGKDYALAPDKPGVPVLLRVLGFLDKEARMAPNALHKYKQINAIFTSVESALADTLQRPATRAAPLRMLELAAGQSSLSLLFAFASRHRWKLPAHIVAVDRDPKRVALGAERASMLGLHDAVRYRRSTIEELGPWREEYLGLFPSATEGGAARSSQAVRPHVVLALHACDTATDHALGAAIAAQAELVAVAPCCQAELAAKWAAQKTEPAAHGFALVHRNPHLRHDTAAHITDALRIALLRAHGYSVQASDFVSMEHTRKNRLIVATRGSTSAQQRDAAWAEYDQLVASTGGEGILLERLLRRDQGGSQRGEDQDER